MNRTYLQDFIAARETLERTETSDFNSLAFETQVGDFWANLQMTTGATSPALLERVWVAARCQHMNANAISTMPLRHYGGREPAWVANPDPVWYSNGISDAVYAMVASLYGYGDAFVYVTERYADGYPSAFTVLDPAPMTVDVVRGQRTYRSGQEPLRASDMVQISRDPKGGVRGTSAIRAYAAYTNGLLAAADMGRVMMAMGTPSTVLKPKRKLDAAQALALQNQWMTVTSARRGAPAVIPPDVEFEKLGFSAEDLQLMSMQQFSAQVIASAFGVPASLINMPIEGGLNYQTPILLLEQWWRTELRTTAFRISGALSANMLPRGSYVEFDPYRFLAPSWKELVDGWVALVEAGLATQEEFRTVVLGLPPQAQEDALAALATPPSAGASPAQGNGSVVALRPTSAGSSF
jgi:HK97 family phage portal protein